MTSLDDLDLMDAQTPATPNGAGSRKHVHVYNKNLPSWVTHGDEEFQSWHLWDCEWNRCEACGPQRSAHVCSCGKVRDEATVRRNRGNRQRGAAFERTVAKKLGGRRTGPLGGRDDVMVGGMFAAQTKRAQRFSLAEARQYLDDLRRTYPDRTPIVVHAFPGERGGVVIVSLDDWVALHGEDAR